jgi:hypothetical protein
MTERHPLIRAQGNLGSAEGGPAAVANYTETRLIPLGVCAPDGRSAQRNSQPLARDREVKFTWAPAPFRESHKVTAWGDMST